MLYLAENPSTGYSWQLDKVAAKGLWVAEEKYEHPDYDPVHPVVGRGGMKKVTIKVGNK